MGRNIEAYKEKYGVEPTEIVIVRYDPNTGEYAGEEHYPISMFDRLKNAGGTK